MFLLVFDKLKINVFEKALVCTGPRTNQQTLESMRVDTDIFSSFRIVCSMKKGVLLFLHVQFAFFLSR